MKNTTTLMLAAIAALFLAACAAFPTGPRVALPVAIGYRVPDTDVVVVLRPDATAEKGYKLTLTGSYKGLEATPTGWKFTSPKTGLVYLIDTSGPNPGLTVIGSGDIGHGVIVNPEPDPAK